MSSADNAQIARRPLLKGLLAGAGILVAAAASVGIPRLLTRHYPPTPFDDLLGLLPDRDGAARLGAAAMGGGFANPVERARALRGHIANHSLGRILDADLTAARLSEVHGWVLPETLVQLCILAAHSGG